MKPLPVRLLAVLASALLTLLLWKLTHVWLLAFGAVLIAILFRSIADPIRAHSRLGDAWSLALAVLLIVGVIGGCSWLMGRQLSAQAGEIAAALPSGLGAFEAELARAPMGERMVAAIEDVRSGGSTGAATRLGGLVSHIARVVSLAAGSALDLLLVIFAGLYFAASPSTYREGLLKLVPRAQRQVCADAVADCGRALRLWLMATLISMTVVGVLTGLGAWAIGLPAPLALGLFAGLAEFVPLIGPLASAVPGVLLGFADSPQTALWAALMYFAVQQVESNLITPLVQKKAVSLPPALTLFGVLAIGALLGPLGVLFATPLVVVGFVLIKRLYLKEALHEEVSIPGAAS